MRLAHLIPLERAGWEALAAGKGGPYYREHLAANAVMAFPFGVLDRNAAIAAIDSALPWQRFEIQDPQVIELGENSGGRRLHGACAPLRPGAVLGGDQQHVRA